MILTLAASAFAEDPPTKRQTAHAPEAQQSARAQGAQPPAAYRGQRTYPAVNGPQRYDNRARRPYRTPQQQTRVMHQSRARWAMPTGQSRAGGAQPQTAPGAMQGRALQGRARQGRARQGRARQGQAATSAARNYQAGTYAGRTPQQPGSNQGSYGYPNNGYRYPNQLPSTSPAVTPATTDATADQEPSDGESSPPYFDAMLGTQAPLSIGAMVSLEIPGRILIQGELGWMPRAYGSMIDGLMKNFPAYDGAIARVVNATLEDAVVGRASLGWRPFESAGFEVHGGYTMLSLGGQSTGTDLADLVGGDFEEQYRSQIANTAVTVDTRLHNIHVGIGWRFVALDDHLVIRASLAYMQTLAADTEVQISEQPEIEKLAQQVADTQLSQIFVDNVKLPVVGLNAGYRF